MLPIVLLIEGVTEDDASKLLEELADAELLSDPDELDAPAEELLPAVRLFCFFACPSSTLRQRDAKFREQRVSPTL